MVLPRLCSRRRRPRGTAEGASGSRPEAGAQAAAPAATGAAKVAVVDFQRAITENSEARRRRNPSWLRSPSGSRILTRSEVTGRRPDQARTQEKVLDDAAKSNLSKQIDQTTTELIA